MKGAALYLQNIRSLCALLPQIYWRDRELVHHLVGHQFKTNLEIPEELPLLRGCSYSWKCHVNLVVVYGYYPQLRPCQMDGSLCPAGGLLFSIYHLYGLWHCHTDSVDNISPVMMCPLQLCKYYGDNNWKGDINIIQFWGVIGSHFLWINV